MSVLVRDQLLIGPAVSREGGIVIQHTILNSIRQNNERLSGAFVGARICTVFGVHSRHLSAVKVVSDLRQS